MKLLNLNILLFVAFILAGCGTMEMASTWRDREIIIDGNQDDWEGALSFIEKKKIFVGVRNDDTNLYACLVTGDRRTKTQILRLGFTVWFDAKGGKDKKLGIRFPIGMEDMDPAVMKEMMKDPLAGGSRDLPPSRLQEVEIVGPGKEDRRRESISELKDLEIKLESSRDLLVYEIKVPLSQREGNSFAVAASAGDLIGIGLETTKINMEVMRDQKQEGMTGAGGRGGGRGGMRGGGRGGGRGGRSGGMRTQSPQMPEQLKVWAKVQLADQ